MWKHHEGFPPNTPRILQTTSEELLGVSVGPLPVVDAAPAVGYIAHTTAHYKRKVVNTTLLAFNAIHRSPIVFVSSNRRGCDNDGS
ncbi:hypothetical protein SNOG_11777 [Parastagonospora nodorum SN15]|uniref:Uncharacterized protein n=1 Tax=Phaeosphaeria nodorum (strain SN15 / ATCC MYA-4574 / FGSC 10173) TaxID=321614 RepID=Q0U8Y7_PHANO|nr:hypothetical protein SNOG_11777 [Parastagonospora nodorum SN15]EAT80821.1 hypothetical protein SNOG_11777 [Parastagonospora nodorum SN15]